MTTHPDSRGRDSPLNEKSINGACHVLKPPDVLFTQLGESEILDIRKTVFFFILK
jgi:hypothetical protein